VAAGGDPGVEPVGEPLDARDPEDPREASPAREVAKNGGEGPGPGEHLAIGQNQVHGTVELPGSQGREPGHPVPLAGRYQRDTTGAVCPPQPAGPAPAERALAVVEEDGSSQQTTPPARGHIAATVRWTASDTSARTKRMGSSEPLPRGLMARLVRNTTKRSCVGSSQSWVPVHPL
jgi:hypothetical protein